MTKQLQRMIALAALVAVCVVYAVTRNPGTSSTVTFLEKGAAGAAIVDDSVESYFDRLQPMEMSAKTGSAITGATLAEQRAECRRRYQAGVLDFTANEIEAIRWHMNKLRPRLARNYPAFAATPWSFIKVSDKIEGGLPHTRGGHIILSASLCRQIMTVRSMPPGQNAYLGIVELLVHEQVHVYQRMHPGSFDSLYSGLWGMLKVPEIVGCNWLVTHHLANPDAVDCRWILPVTRSKSIEYVLPLLVFSEGNWLKQMPDDFHMLAISLQRTTRGLQVKVDAKGKPVYAELPLVPEFNAIFPMSNNIYHPNEAAADMFAKLIIYDHFLPDVDLPADRKKQIEITLGPLRAWFKANLGKRRNK